MAESTQTLEIEVRTKDFATANLQRVADAGEAAGRQIRKGTEEANTGLKSFTDRWLKLDGDFKRVASVGISAMSSINAGIATANATGENMGRTLLSAGASIAAGFAAGGPVGGALAVTSSAIGLIVSKFGEAEREAKKLGDEIYNNLAPAINKAMGSGAAAIGRVIDQSAAMARQIEIDERVAQGADRARVTRELEYRDTVKAVTAALAERQTAEYRANELLMAAQRQGRDTTREEEQVRLAQAARMEAERAVKAIEAMDSARGRANKAAEEAAAHEEFNRKTIEEQNALKSHQQALDWARKQASAQMTDELVRQANEMVRLSRLSEDELKVDKLVTMEEQLRLRGRTELADALKKMVSDQLHELQQARDLTAEEKRRKAELQAYEALMEENAKNMGFFANEAKKAKDHLKDAAGTNLAAPIRAAADELKKIQTTRGPGRGGATFDEAGRFQGLGLAEARQERRDALRSMKRRRAEAGRMGFGLGETAGVRVGRRAGGLGAFSGLEGELTDMGVAEQPAPFPSIAKRLAAKPKPFVRPGAGISLPIVGGGAVLPGMEPIGPELIDKTTGNLKSMADQQKVLAEALKRQADASEGTKAGADEAAAAAGEAADAMRGTTEAMGGVVVKLKDLAEEVWSHKREIERLKEAANLRGGN